MQGVVTWETLLGLGTILAAVIGVWLRIEWNIGILIAAAVEPIGSAQAGSKHDLAVARGRRPCCASN